MLTRIDMVDVEMGDKADGLKLMMSLGLRVPATYLVEDCPSIDDVYRTVGFPCIFRSSGVSEGNFPGVFESVPVLWRTDQALREAFLEVLNSPQSGATRGYDTYNVKMHVLLQKFFQRGLFGVFARGTKDLCSMADSHNGATTGKAMEAEFSCFRKSVVYDAIEKAVSAISMLFDHFELEWVFHNDSLYILQFRSIQITGGQREVPDVCDMSGFSVGSGEVEGVVCTLDSFCPGGVLVLHDPDEKHEPFLRSSLALVSDHGTATSHLAMRARELDKPALFGTRVATSQLKVGDKVILHLSDLGTGYLMRR